MSLLVHIALEYKNEVNHSNTSQFPQTTTLLPIFLTNFWIWTNNDWVLTGWPYETRVQFFLKKMGQSRPLYVYFRLFHIIDESIDGVLGTWTRGSRMEGADESTELWRHPERNYCNPFAFVRTEVSDAINKLSWMLFYLGKCGWYNI